MSFQALLERHAAASLDKQLALGDLLGEHEWSMDLEAGTITFEPAKHSFPVQVIGFESELTDTFRWAWAGGEGALESLRPALLRAASTLRSLGESAQISELTTDEILLRRVDGHRIALVASGICGADAYYRCGMEGGAAFVLIDSPTLEKRSSDPGRFLQVFQALVDAVPLDAARALRHYAGWKRWPVVETEGGLDVAASSGETIRVLFDEAGKVKTANILAATSATALADAHGQ